MLFVLNESDTPFLPNSAKKGYPLFDREQIEIDGGVTLADFCSYLAADRHSTARLYLNVLNSLPSSQLTSAEPRGSHPASSFFLFCLAPLVSSEP